MRILIVEDDRAARSGLEKWLIKQGHSVCWAETGERAIEQLKFGEIDLVVLDLNLGEGSMSGWDVARYKYGDAKLRKIPIVVVTGLSTEDVHAGAKVNVFEGQSLILPKPVDLRMLAAYLKSLIPL
jgi:DNA-binding response OmpR family regulator